MTDHDKPEHRRACVQCRGEGWTNGAEVNGWPTLNPCPECRPITAALLAAGAYAADAPTVKDSDRFQAIADTTGDRPGRTALWPWPQMLTEWPAPGPRTTFPNTHPKGKP